MIRVLLIVLTLTLGCHAELPQPDGRGEYSRRTLHTHWQVVDPDPQGMNGRLAPDFPNNYEDSRIPWPTSEPLSWPVVARFPSGSSLQACTGNLGVLRIKDSQGRYWMMVKRPKGSGFCFVRSHQRFLRPVPPPPQSQD